MACKSCSSGNQIEFHAEINIHFGGLKNLHKPSVWVFPILQVCTDCGFAEFGIPEKALFRLAERESNGTGTYFQEDNSVNGKCLESLADKLLAVQNSPYRN